MVGNRGKQVGSKARRVCSGMPIKPSVCSVGMACIEQAGMSSIQALQSVVRDSTVPLCPARRLSCSSACATLLSKTSLNDGMRPTCIVMTRYKNVLLRHNQHQQMIKDESCDTKSVLLDQRRDQQ